jgi:phosphoribosylformylglycinamidine synthase subunit PurQ / glutaminase
MGVAVLQFPGSNCDDDARYVCADILGQTTHLIWHTQYQLPNNTDLVIIPGGFSYGDHLRTGAIAAHSPIMAAVKAFATDGGLVLGICNGFQILTEAGLLPGALLRNSCLHFLCKTTELVVERSDTAFTSGYAVGRVLSMPIAHNEGCYYADSSTLERLEGEGQVVFRYRHNPNGSLNDIAGIINPAGNILGMMPHPERAAEPLMGSQDGLGIFQSVQQAGLYLSQF